MVLITEKKEKIIPNYQIPLFNLKLIFNDTLKKYLKGKLLQYCYRKVVVV